MKRVGVVVIGAGYGDEGKGLMTDYLCRKYADSACVRYNGGAQSGHTVVTMVKRHVFGHYGAGTFAGAPTILSRKFVVNPFVYHGEGIELETKGIKPMVMFHPMSMVTTGYDMTLNGLREISRGVNRHGTCGLGLNETITRSLYGYDLRVKDFDNVHLTDKLAAIHKYWNEEVEALNLDKSYPEVKDLLDLMHVDREKAYLFEVSKLFEIGSVDAGCYIFEGGQGLGLDEHLGQFPHVTRSITGLVSAAVIAAELGVTELQPIYMTRCYKTRHGCGPLLHEGETITSYKLSDVTNAPNRWQGDLRYAPLDVKELHKLIYRDLNRTALLSESIGIKILPAVMGVTCLDQVDDVVWYDRDGVRRETNTGTLLCELDTGVLPVKYISNGPRACDIDVLY
jgi:adenylosuccinate synthase